MDPNATLSEIRQIVHEHAGRDFMSDDVADRLVELFDAHRGLMLHASVLRGLEQSARGETHDLGSFAQYAERCL